MYKTVWTLYKGETLIAQSDNGDALTRNKKIAMVLDEEFTKCKKLYKSCLKLKHQWKNIHRMFPVYQQQNIIQEIIKLHVTFCHF